MRIFNLFADLYRCHVQIQDIHDVGTFKSGMPINCFMQVSSDSVYLTDDTNHAIFPNDRGDFTTYQLCIGGHYQVHGDGGAVDDSMTSGRSIPSLPVTTTPVSAFNPFAFAQRPLSGTSTMVKKTAAKTFQRYAFFWCCISIQS